MYGRSKFLESSEFFFVPKDVQCSETDFSQNSTTLRLSVFEIWSMLFSTFVVHWGRIQKKMYDREFFLCF